MSFVLPDLILPLLAAVLLGLGLGWLMWRWRHRQVTSLEWDSILAESSARHTRVMELEDLIEGQEREVVELAAKPAGQTPPADATESANIDQPADKAAKPQQADQASSGQVSAGQAETSELERALAEAQLRIAELEARPIEPDDLRKIKGIGPKLEKILHQAGVTSFADLAELDSGGIEALQEQLSQFPGKIERDDWVGQARQLMNR